MTKLFMRSMRSSTGANRTEDDHSAYRRWARAMCIIDFVVFAALLVGVSLYDLRTNQMAHQARSISTDAPTNLQTTSVISKGG